MSYEVANFPLIKELTKKFKGPSDIIKELESMKVLPSVASNKIIVLGDKNVGKSSLIGNLTGINYPGKINMPVVLKFERTSSSAEDNKIYTEYYNFGVVEVDYKFSGVPIMAAAEKMEKNVSVENRFITLTIKQCHVDMPDFTIVEIPGIKQFTDKDKQEKELKLMQGYVNQHTGDEECLFINVINSASPTTEPCLSTHLLEILNKSGNRTITVVTRADMCSKDMRLKLTINKAPPFGYLFNDITWKAEEYKNNQGGLFSAFDQNNFGIDAVANKVVIGLLSILFNPSSPIIYQIQTHLRLFDKEKKQSKSPFKTVANALSTVLMIACKSQYSLYRLLIAQDYNEYQDDTQAHAYLRLCDKLRDFQINLTNLKLPKQRPFLVDEIEILTNQLNRPLPSNMLIYDFFNPLIHMQVDIASTLVDTTVSNIFHFLDKLFFKVVSGHTVDFKRLASSLKQPVLNVLSNARLGLEKKVARMLELEKTFPGTSDPGFISAWEKYKQLGLEVNNIKEKNTVMLQGLGEVHVTHLHDYSEATLKDAFNLKMLICAYWESASKRIVDHFTLILMESLRDMVSGEMVMTIMEPFIRVGEEQNMLAAEEPMLSVNRAILTYNFDYLNKAMEEIKRIQLDFPFLL